MIWNFLADENANPAGGYMLYAVLGVLIVLMIVWLIFSNRKGKQRQKEYAEQIAAIRPGNKVKTIGGICGIVVELCDDNTVIIETGSEQSGKSFIKMDKDCISQTDAKGPMQLAREEEEARKKAQKEGKNPAPAANAAPEGEPAQQAEPETVREEPAAEQPQVQESAENGEDKA